MVTIVPATVRNGPILWTIDSADTGLSRLSNPPVMMVAAKMYPMTAAARAVALSGTTD
jgi:hypothetical protein